MKINFKTYKLFYLLTLVLIFIGLITRNIETVSYGWHSTILVGYSAFFLPSCLSSLLLGLIYWYAYKTNRIINEKLVVLHFILMALGLILLFITIFYAFYINSNFTQNESKIILISGPAILISSLFVFIYGIAKSKKSEISKKSDKC